MTNDRGDRAGRVRDMRLDADRRVDEIARKLESRSEGPLPGDLYWFTHDTEATVLWAVVKPHPDGEDLHLVVPSDTNPLSGSADVRIPEQALCGPLTVRCDRAQWLPREGFAVGKRVGYLEDIYIAWASTMLGRLATGEPLPVDEGARQIDWAPEYRNWIRTIARASDRVRERVRLVSEGDTERPETVCRTVASELNANPLVTSIAAMVRGGMTPLQATKVLLAANVPEPQLKAARAEFERLTGRIRNLREPAALVSNEQIENWYVGPQADDKFWPALESYLREQRRWQETAITDLNVASTKILSLLDPAGHAQFSRRGLVLGYVQSGKTANFTALISKAADVGYRLFIVLSGMHKALREQTQLRLQRELINLRPESWHALTTPKQDFRIQGNVNAFLSENDQKVLCVVKKNARVLEKLDGWLGAARSEALQNCPVLVIDDEADQASVNASRVEEERTAINRLILQILGRLPKVGYVGYTATPYANIFIDPSIPTDLYPRDFIVDLPRPRDYFGPERIFGRARLTQDEPLVDGLDMIRTVPEDEVPELKPRGHLDYQGFEPQITPTMEDALRYFWMACACRLARGHLATTSELAQRHASMLIHTTLYADVHNDLRPEVEKYITKFTGQLARPSKQLRKALEKQWDDEVKRVSPASAAGGPAIRFDQIEPHLTQAVSMTRVVVENSRSDIRLTYGDDPTIQIVIGGNSLSRGLTLEGLIVSFFVRASTAYDTLMQMGRWFGYRPGYEDLPRIWMTEDLENWFYDLATVDQEIRNDIKRYELEGITPRDFGPRVRTHPILSITTAAKMGKAIDCQVSYGGRRVQTILFQHKDAKWLRHNLDAGKRLLARLRADGAVQDRVKDRFWRFRDVPAEAISAFIEDYRFHANSQELKGDLIREYIREQNWNGALTRWNVVVVGRRADMGVTEIDLGSGIKVPLLERSRLRRPGADANIGVLMTAQDAVIDLDDLPEELASLREAERMRLRDRVPFEERRGLLLLYPVSKNSKPGTDDERSKRAPLEAVEDLLGVALVFPGVPSEMETPIAYKTVDLSDVDREEVEFPTDEEAA